MNQRTRRSFFVPAVLLAPLVLGWASFACFGAEEKPAEKTTPPVAAPAAAAPPSAEEKHVKETISFLASDGLEGRGPGTKGIDQAAEFIAAEFKKAGLKTDLFAGQPYQAFSMGIGSELGKRNSLTLVGPPGPDGKPRRIELKLGQDYSPLSIGGSGKINVPLVFVGYGITAKQSSQAALDPHADPHANPHGDPHAKPADPKTPTPKGTAPKAQPAAAKEPAKEKEPVKEPAKEAAKPQAVVDPHAAPVKAGAKPEDAIVYDDYAGIDVKGKCVVVFRHQPQQGNPHGILPGIPNSPHAPFTRKISNAYEHGAAAVIFVTSDYDINNKLEARRKQWQEAVDEILEEQKKFAAIKKPTPAQTAEYRKTIDAAAQQVLDQSKKLDDERDPLLEFRSAGGSSDGSRLPAMHARRKVWDTLLTELKKPTLAGIEKQIDEGPKPQSFSLEGWSVEGEVDVERKEAEVKNVVGVLEGDGPHADETVVIGAHYDHLGFGGEGSFVPTVREIHNGADDNASGTTALLEAARLLGSSGKKPGRRIVFIAFTAEERGLIGSARYCKDPLFPLEKTVAMLNMDMVGRLTDDKLIIQGGDTAKEFTTLLDKLNADEFHFKLTHNPGGFGPSDHASFYAKKVPVLHFFTGLHKDYHRPTDDADKVNAAGLIRVAKMVSDTAATIAQLPERPTYQESKAGASGGGDRGGDRPYFGSIPDFAQSEPGYGISGVAKGSPSEKAGLKSGDVIIKLGESRVGNLDDFDSALRKFKAGDKVTVVVKREGKEVSLSVTLGAPR
ncbi:MAG: M20/M25/M40 family metallo-hydrolase [Planctomycetia bacterium]|nr:M20/M25/M40 family metallo-hydrolase [Planctomycetia bacterium]